MSQDEIFTIVKKIVAEQLGADESQISPGTRFIDDLGGDSLGCVELALALEESLK